MTTETLNMVEGVRCNEVMGAMYAFPRIFLPDRAIAEAKVSIPLFIYFCCLRCSVHWQGLCKLWGLSDNDG